MEVMLENIKTKDWEFSTTLSSEELIGISGPDYEELLEILKLALDILSKMTYDKNLVERNIDKLTF